MFVLKDCTRTITVRYAIRGKMSKIHVWDLNTAFFGRNTIARILHDHRKKTTIFAPLVQFVPARQCRPQIRNWNHFGQLTQEALAGKSKQHTKDTSITSSMDSPSLPEEAMTPQEKDNDKQIETPYTQGSPEACSPEMEGVKSDLACKFANEEDAPPKSKYNRTTKIMCFCVGFLMVAAVVITAVLLTYDGTESKNINQFENDAEKSPIAPIAPSPPVAAPVAPIFSQPMAPVATPTSPVATPTAPVGTPTAPNPTASPTLNPTALPTPTPSVSVQSRIVEFLATNQVVVNSQDPSSNMAITVLAEELGDLETVDPSKVIQRFAILTVDFALRASGRVDAPAPDIDTPVDGNTADAPIGGNTTGGFLDATDGDATDVPLGDGNATGGFFDTTNGDDTATTNPSTTDTDQGNGGFFDAGSDSFADAFGGMRRLELSMDECLWDGVTCIDGIVTEIRFHNQLMEGTIPTEIALLSGLKYLDLSQNQLQGMIPEALYELVEIEDVFLYQNQLTGSISSSVGNWLNITHLHLSHNQLTGSIPSTMASGSSTRPYCKCSLISSRCFPH